ncbi:MAG: DUF4412 domain-containing protein [Bacteroidales bacterium]|nr:DUF4412 domain-containing protein [Bacteroidales bacterium]
MVNFLLSFLLLLSSTNTNVESFEGSIEMIQESYYDISYFTYFVKKENVRIDKFDNNHTLTQSLLINLEKEQIYILNPSKKLYTKSDINSKPNPDSENFTILKTENSRMVGEYVCYQWRVKNMERNTEVSYWVSQNNFYFFEELVRLINNTDKTYEFFEKIPETQGFFPMLCVERTLLRKEKYRLYVINITNNAISDDIFKIPSDFELVVR